MRTIRTVHWDVWHAVDRNLGYRFQIRSHKAYGSTGLYTYRAVPKSATAPVRIILVSGRQERPPCSGVLSNNPRHSPRVDSDVSVLKKRRVAMHNTVAREV